MSISVKGCEKCDGAGARMQRLPGIPGVDDGEAFLPCPDCAEPWGPQPLDAPDGPGWWWMLVDGAAPEAVRVEVLTIASKAYVHVYTTRGTFGMIDLFAPAAKWLRITAPEVPQC